jgi:hypothetical protein
MLNLPDHYIAKNYREVAVELATIQGKDNICFMSLDINDLFVNIPITDTIRITRLWLHKHNQDGLLIKQITHALEVILKQNYFQYSNQIYKPVKGIAMGSPTSSTIAEIYLQYMEEFFIKQAMDDNSILYYKRYGDDLLLACDKTKTGADMILNTTNKLDSNLTFKDEMEINNFINYLVLSVNKSDNQITIDVYQKPTYIDITIHYTSNHPHLQKLAGFHFFIQRLNSLPLTENAKEQEWIWIITTARYNGFPEHIIQEIKHKHNKNTITHAHQMESIPQHKKWSKFQFHSPAIYKITNMFKKTDVKIAFKATNTIFHQLTYKPKKDNPAGIYR